MTSLVLFKTQQSFIGFFNCLLSKLGRFIQAYHSHCSTTKTQPRISHLEWYAVLVFCEKNG